MKNLLLQLEQDKWRNINSSAMGGSRQRAKVAAQMLKSCPEHDIETMHLIMEPPKDKDVLEVTPIAMVSGTPKDSGSKKPVPRLVPSKCSFVLTSYMSDVIQENAERCILFH